MSAKKVKIKINPENLKNILESFGMSTETFDIELNLPDCKDTYKKLTSLNGILDWDFVEVENEGTDLYFDNLEKISEINLLDNNKKHEGDLSTLLISRLKIDNFNKISTFIEANRRLSIKIPKLEFGTEKWVDLISPIYEEVGSEKISFDHMSMKVLCESFYSINRKFIGFEDVLRDLLKRLENIWTELPSYLMTSAVAKKLFG